MNEQIEKLVRMALEANASSIDVTFEATGEVRVNIYPRESVQPKAITVNGALTPADMDRLSEAITGVSTQRLQPGRV